MQKPNWSMTITSWLLCLMTMCQNDAYGFVSPRLSSRQRCMMPSSSLLQFSSSGGGDDSNREYSAFTHNMRRTCIHQFLTQRSIQSFMFLLTQIRDPHTANWIENMANATNLLEYHGSGAFNLTRYPDWDSIFVDMIDRPRSKIILQAKRRGRGHGGWSKHNPYLKERFVEFEISVDPPSLVSRILSVREQIAIEWTNDLDLLAKANEEILESYHNHNVLARQDEKSSSSSTSKNTDTIPNQDGSSGGHDQESVPSDYFSTTQSSEKNQVFHKLGLVAMLLNKEAFEGVKSSPFRKGSFDLLSLLSMQEGVHRVLRQYKAENNIVALEWLRDFYIDKIDEYFDGSGPYGRADDFLEELFLSTPSINRNLNKFNDPMAIAEDIVHMRTLILLEWKHQMKTIPDDHNLHLRKLLFDKQWGSSTTTTTNDNIATTETTTLSSMGDEPNEFQ